MAPLLTIDQLAATLGVSPRTVSREISDGALTAVRVRDADRALTTSRPHGGFFIP